VVAVSPARRVAAVLAGNSIGSVDQIWCRNDEGKGNRMARDG